MAKQPRSGDPKTPVNRPTEKDPETYEVPEIDPSPVSPPQNLPPDPDRAPESDPNTVGHDIEVEGP